MSLEIKELHVEVDGTEILHGVSLKLEAAQMHALMGPNGSGKSTLAYTIMGHPKYTVRSGSILVDGVDITNASPSERAAAGIFLSFQYPQAISGVTVSSFLRMAVNKKRKLQGEKEFSVVEFHKLLKQTMAKVGIDSSFTRRSLNEGFSGGEKKRMEMLQLALLKPKYALLDETDSGLDVDAIKLVSSLIASIRQEHPMSVLVISHYTRFLEFLNPDKVSVLCRGKITKQGGKELAAQIEAAGFDSVISQ